MASTSKRATEGHVGSTRAWLVLASRSAALCESPVVLALARVVASCAGLVLGCVVVRYWRHGANGEAPGPPTGKGRGII